MSDVKQESVQLNEPVFVVTETERQQLIEILKPIPLGQAMPIFDFLSRHMRPLNVFMQEQAEQARNKKNIENELRAKNEK
jgi:hypothetical protein